MLTVTPSSVDVRDVRADLLVVPVFKGGIEGPGAGAVLTALGFDAFPVTPDFRGDVGQTLLLSSSGLAARGALLVGLGRMDEADSARLRRAAGVAARAAGRAKDVATTLAEVHASSEVVQAVAEGFALGAYADRRFRTGEVDAPALETVTVLVPSSRLAESRAAVERAMVGVRAVRAARDLVNLPPDRKRPSDFAAAVEQLAGEACAVTVLDELALAEGGYGGLLAVGGGSSAPPRLVELSYRPAEPLGHVVLAGKGITFDTGGLSLKRGGAMDEMKADMAGAAVVAAVCGALGELGVPLEVTGLLPCAENMPSGSAQRPGDIVTVRGGTTVEVRDTDAEGRLVLADVLAEAAARAPDAIVDVATLTGSSVTALGRHAAALLGSDEDLVDALRRAARLAGEDLWELPLWPSLESLIDSPIADCNNTGDGAGGGAITASLFLRRFVGEVPWAHLDIAGPAFLPPELAQGELTPGATGFGVRTLLGWLSRPPDGR